MSDDSRPTQTEAAGRGLSHWLGQFLDRLGLRGGGTIREDIAEALAEDNGQTHRSQPAGAGDAQQRAEPARAPRRRRHGAARRHRRRARRCDAGRAARPVPDRRPFAPAGLSTRRSTIRAAWSTSATSSTSSPSKRQGRRGLRGLSETAVHDLGGGRPLGHAGDDQDPARPCSMSRPRCRPSICW